MKPFTVILFIVLIANDANSQNSEFLNKYYSPINVSAHKTFSDYNNETLTTQSGILGKHEQKIMKHASEGISKFYIKLNAGFGAFTPGSYYVDASAGYAYLDQSVIHDSTTTNRSSRGIGSGLKFGGGIGYILNDFINIGLDADYLMGATLKSSSSSYGDINNYQARNVEMHYRTITLTPYIIFKALARPKYFIYNKLGILVTLPSTLDSSGTEIGGYADYRQVFGNADTVAFTGSPYSYNAKFKMSLGVGLNIAFGINFRLTNKLRAFGELFGNYTALSPSRSTLTYSSKDLTTHTTDSSGAVTTTFEKKLNFGTINTAYQKGGPLTYQQTSYQNIGVTSDGYTETKQTVAVQSHTYTINMAVLGINVGIIYRF